MRIRANLTWRFFGGIMPFFMEKDMTTSKFNSLIDYIKSNEGSSFRKEIEECNTRDELYTVMTRVGIKHGYVASSDEIDGWIKERMAERTGTDVLSDSDLREVSGGSLTSGETDASQPPWTGGSDIPSHCPSPCFPERTDNIYCKIAATIKGEC